MVNSGKFEIINSLDNTIHRTVTTCNIVTIEKVSHADRVMPEHDFIYIFEGEWEIYQDDIAYRLTAGDYLLLHAGRHHYGTKPCMDNTKLAFIHFTQEAKDGITHVASEQAHTPEYFRFPPSATCTQTALVERLLNQIVAAFWSSKPNRQVRTSILLDMLLCELESQYLLGTPGSRYNFEPLFQYINQHLHRFFTIPELADYMDISPKTLTSHFRKYTGMSIHQYQMNLKLDMAHDFIEYQPQITLKELASSYGFYDEYHFHKCYKKKFGHPPKA